MRHLCETVLELGCFLLKGSLLLFVVVFQPDRRRVASTERIRSANS